MQRLAGIAGIGKEISKSPWYGYVCLRRHRLRLFISLVLFWCICHFVILNFSGNIRTSKASDSENRLNVPINFASAKKYKDTSSIPISKPKQPLSRNDSFVFTDSENHEHTSSTPTTPKPKLPLALTWNSFEFIHSDGRSSRTDENAPFVVVFPYSTTENNISQELLENDKLAVWKLSEFLRAMKGYDGATCLQPTHGREDDHLREHKEPNSTRNIYLDSSWCRFIKREWSVHIRNTGQVQSEIMQVKPLGNESSLPVNFKILFQNCNIVQGPFLIRKDAFDRTGGLTESFGKLKVLEFFIRSKSQLKMAKLSNCAWTPGITRVDRGSLEGSHNVAEYGSFGNKHGVLRIVTENRIEWTRCVANWKLCPEKPYVKPQDLPSIAKPICCSTVLGQMLADITWAFTRLGVEYRIIYGTLLGAVRSQAIIPWTADVDIAITKAAIDNTTTFSSVEKLLGNQYYVGNSFMGVPRAHMLMGPYIDVDTTPFFDGPDDLEGNLLFSNDIEEAVRGMLPVSSDWRGRCYADIYWSPSAWMNGSSLVTINNQQFVTVKEVEYELTNWYGNNYREPAIRGNWVGFSDQGTA
ncbi:hypothetical protein ACROYT_G002747 [Oculina patagonica]